MSTTNLNHWYLTLAGNGAKDITEDFNVWIMGFVIIFCIFLCNIAIRFLLKSGYKDENYKAKPMPLMAEGLFDVTLNFII